MPVTKWPASEPPRVNCLDKVPPASLLLFISRPNSRGFFHHFFFSPRKYHPESQEINNRVCKVGGNGIYQVKEKACLGLKRVILPTLSQEFPYEYEYKYIYTHTHSRACKAIYKSIRLSIYHMPTQVYILTPASVVGQKGASFLHIHSILFCSKALCSQNLH